MIIPKSTQKSVIGQIHQKSHIDINKCLNRLKDVLFCSGSAARIKDNVSQFATCSNMQ